MKKALFCLLFYSSITARVVFEEIHVSQSRTYITNLLVDGAHKGRVCCHVEKSGIGFIDWITVDESERCKGYAFQLLQNASSILRKEKCSMISLAVAGKNKVAQNLYKKFGFSGLPENMQPEFYYEMEKLLID